MSFTDIGGISIKTLRAQAKPPYFACTFVITDIDGRVYRNKARNRSKTQEGGYDFYREVFGNHGRSEWACAYVVFLLRQPILIFLLLILFFRSHDPLPRSKRALLPESTIPSIHEGLGLFYAGLHLILWCALFPGWFSRILSCITTFVELLLALYDIRFPNCVAVTLLEDLELIKHCRPHTYESRPRAGQSRLYSARIYTFTARVHT